MIGDTVEYNGKNYTFKRNVKLGEFSRLTKLNRELLEMAMSEPPDIEKIGIEKFKEQLIEQGRKNDDIVQMTVNTLASLLGLTQEELEDIDLEDAVLLFQKAWGQATTVKKKLEEPSVLPTS